MAVSEGESTASRLCQAMIDIIRPLRDQVTIFLEGEWMNEIFYQIRRQGINRSSILLQLLSMVIEGNLGLLHEVATNEAFMDYIFTESLCHPNVDILHLLMKLAAGPVGS